MAGDMVDDGFGGMTEAPDTGGDEGDADGLDEGAEGAGAGDAAGGDVSGDAAAPRSAGGAGNRGPDGKFRKDPTDADSGTPKPEAPPRPTKLKRKEKVNGEEVELEATEDELWASYRQRTAANKRFEEAAAERKKAEEMKKGSLNFVKALLSDPRKALAAAGIKDPAQQQAWFEENFARVLEDADLTPEQRELAEYRAEKAEREAQAAAEREREEQEAASAEEQAEADRILGVMGEALKKHALPKDDVTVRTMAQEWRRAREAGHDLTPDELALSTREALSANFEAHVGGLEGEDLLNAYPTITKKFLDAVRARVTAKNERVSPRPSTQTAPRPRASAPEREEPVLKRDSDIDRILGIG